MNRDTSVAEQPENPPRTADGSTSRRRFLAATGTAIALAGAGPAVARRASQADAGTTLTATLAGENSVPPIESTGSGTAEFTVNDDGTMAFRVEVRDLEGVTQAHVHEGGPDENGPVVAPLFQFTEAPDGTGGEPRDATADEPIVEEGTVDDAGLVERIVADPGAFYVNVHTVANPPGEIRGQLRAGEEPTPAEGEQIVFAVRIENVSTDQTLQPSTGEAQPVPLSPGVFAVHTTPAPLFAAGQPDRGEGLERIAEDGDPTDLAAALRGQEGIEQSGAFDTPVEATEPSPIGPGQAYEFTVTAVPGDRLSFATMFVPSNDLFYAPGEEGIALFTDAGEAVEGEVTDQVALWDAGTEVNEEPGVGPTQVQRQEGPDTGPDEDGTVRQVAEVADGFTYPAVADVIRVVVEPVTTVETPAENETAVNETEAPTVNVTAGNETAENETS